MLAISVSEDPLEPPILRPKIPQEVQATGIGQDYLHEFSFLEGMLKDPGAFSDIWQTILKRAELTNPWTGKNYPPRVRTYFERYVHENFGGHVNISEADLINDRSRERIPELDKRVQELNTLLAGGQEKDRARCIQIVDEMKILVMGQ